MESRDENGRSKETKGMSGVTRPVILVLALSLAVPQIFPTQSWSAGQKKGKGRPYVSSTPNLPCLSETVIDPYIPWPTFYGVNQTGAVDATFDCFGLFGIGLAERPDFIPQWPQASFQTPPGSLMEYLFGATIWFGGIVGQDTLVSHGCDELYMGYEFYPADHPAGSVTKFEYPTDYSMRAVFTDTITDDVADDWSGRPHIPLNIKVINRSHVWRTPEDEDFIIYDLVITNIGDQLIENAYMGIFADCDAGDWSLPASMLDDVSGSIRDLGIAYTIDNDGDPVGTVFDPVSSTRKIFALRLLASSEPLADTNFNWWHYFYTVEEDFGPRMHGTPEDPFFDFGTGGNGTPMGDRNIYYVLSHKEWDYDQVYTASIAPDDPVWEYPPQDHAESITLGMDTRFALSWGPFNLEPDSSIRLLLTTFTGDNVHDFALNCELNLPDHPYAYISNLDTTDVMANSRRAEERAEFLLDPLMPVPGLYVAYRDQDSAVIAWDPWVFDNIEGYEVYLSEVPDEWLPYPGTAPPWLRPATLENVASLEVVNQVTLTELDPNKFYFVNVAHRSQSGIGSEGVPIIIGRPEPGPAPKPFYDFAYFYDQGPARISFIDTTGWDIDHYRVYKFADQELLAERYRPFYSQYLLGVSLTPRDSFDVDGTTYYYFTMEPYATLNSDATYFEDWDPAEGAYYLVTAVDVYGFESDFSTPVQGTEVYVPTRDILVISKLPVVALASFDTVKNFYNEILSDFDYDFYCVRDTITKYACDPEFQDCIDWRDFTRFKMVIIDMDSYDNFVTSASEERFSRLAKYIMSGGRLVYFGCFYGMNYFYTNKARYYKQETTLVEPYFGADSLFFYHLNYYYWNYLPLDHDSCFGFQWAEPIHPDLPEVAFDTLRHPFVAYVDAQWQDKTPPSVATFVPRQHAEILYRYRSRYPELSRLEGQPVGLRVHDEAVDTYLFGFHLWYMQVEQARELIQTILTGLSLVDTPEIALPTLPEEFALRQNYPNPFNPVTEICFDLPRNALVTLHIYNVLGQRVKSLIDGRMYQAGSHSIQWRGDDEGGCKVSSGIYFCRLEAGDKTATKKMMLLK